MKPNNLQYQGHKTIYSTVDYSQFKLFEDSNRDVNQHHVSKLAESIKKTGENVQAIIVIWYKDAYYVIEGQHRLAACMEAKIPVKFEIVEKIKGLTIREFIIELNINSKNWNPETYFRTKAKSGGKVYDYWLEILNREGNWALVSAFMRMNSKDVKNDVVPKIYPYVDQQLSALHEISKIHKEVTLKHEQHSISIHSRELAKAIIALQSMVDVRIKRGEKLPKMLPYKKMVKSFGAVMSKEGVVPSQLVIARVLSKAIDHGKHADERMNLMGGQL